MSELTLSDRAFEAALLAVDRVTAQHLLQVAAAADRPPLHLVEHLVVPALERIGRNWEQGRVALSQVYMSGRLCEELVDALLPTTSPVRRRQPKMAIVVLEDYHLLGKRMVYAVLRAAGYDLLDYGRSTTTELVSRVQTDGVELLLISTLMLPSALRVAEVRRALDQAGCRTRLIVGGAPFRLDPKLWREVGADAMGGAASDVVQLVAGLTGGAA